MNDTDMAGLEFRLRLADAAATEALGAALARAGGDGGLIFLRGQLGAGKTTLTRGVLRALGHPGNVKSPTYTLVEPYESIRPPVYHFDLYRLADPEELEFMGIRDYIQAEHLCLVEWPERGEAMLPVADLEIALAVSGEAREVCCRAGTARGEKMNRNLRETVLSTHSGETP
ncbi:tRNA (adenosine(37)-N6)-threonylcarbamoyltransferase complex ATPase subunit type 1 TsaE [Marinobacteraceae bacterium S3BR75-40.1]